MAQKDRILFFKYRYAGFLFFFLDDGKINVCVLDKSSSLQDLAFCFGDVSAIIQITVYFLFFFNSNGTIYLGFEISKTAPFSIKYTGSVALFLTLRAGVSISDELGSFHWRPTVVFEDYKKKPHNAEFYTVQSHRLL